MWNSVLYLIINVRGQFDTELVFVRSSLIEVFSVANKLKEDLIHQLEYSTSATKAPARFWDGPDGVNWQMTNGTKITKERLLIKTHQLSEYSTSAKKEPARFWEGLTTDKWQKITNNRQIPESWTYNF